MSSERDQSGLALLQTQRSHILLVLSRPKEGCEMAFREWYLGPYRRMLDASGALESRLYEQDETDITRGRFPRLPFGYLSIHELSLDGAHEADRLIESITRLHREQVSAEAPATWLYYPIGEKVGRRTTGPSMLVMACANGVVGREAEFREWYITRHIRHALKISSLASGQCFERTGLQRSGALDASFSIIAMYEHMGTAQDFLDSHAAVPKGSLAFPSLDLGPSRFSEWLYRPL